MWYEIIPCGVCDIATSHRVTESTGGDGVTTYTHAVCQKCLSAAPPDPVEEPAHYVRKGLELHQVIHAWELGYYDGCAVKYILRAQHKGKREEDLRKAIKCLELELSGVRSKNG
jgi:hypothetical protein